MSGTIRCSVEKWKPQVMLLGQNWSWTESPTPTCDIFSSLWTKKQQGEEGNPYNHPTHNFVSYSKCEFEINFISLGCSEKAFSLAVYSTSTGREQVLSRADVSYFNVRAVYLGTCSREILNQQVWDGDWILHLWQALMMLMWSEWPENHTVSIQPQGLWFSNQAVYWNHSGSSTNHELHPQRLQFHWQTCSLGAGTF